MGSRVKWYLPLLEEPVLSVNSAPWTGFVTRPIMAGRSFIPFGAPTRPAGLVVMGAKCSQFPVDPGLGLWAPRQTGFHG